MGKEMFVIMLVSFLASIIGSICGIGGGIIIKPVLDSLSIFTLSTINFLSGCTVLAMAFFNVVGFFTRKENNIELKSSFLLAIGGIIGGFLGKYIFEVFQKIFVNPSYGSAIQSFILLIINLGYFIYTINKGKIKTLKVTSILIIIAIGCGLGFLSAFLGIGGGPINIVILHFFFSMLSKQAAQNSLFIIFFSQATSLIQTVITKSMPNVSLPILFEMMVCGIAGAFVGKIINKKIAENIVNKLFIVTMILLILLNIYNFIIFIN